MRSNRYFRDGFELFLLPQVTKAVKHLHASIRRGGVEAKMGDKPCDHPHIETETYRGGSSGDHVCTQCGCEMSREKRDRIEAERKKKQDK
jgi:hypothetical protein